MELQREVRKLAYSKFYETNFIFSVVTFQRISGPSCHNSTSVFFKFILKTKLNKTVQYIVNTVLLFVTEKVLHTFFFHNTIYAIRIPLDAVIPKVTLLQLRQ